MTTVPAPTQLEPPTPVPPFFAAFAAVAVGTTFLLAGLALADGVSVTLGLVFVALAAACYAVLVATARALLRRS
ncbi:MAG TPA: hypothetical protein VFJ91_05225 [Gaiellaceae bacterium]|nr:hypothetical protein [Gaiellaceae bacterium]